MSFGYTGKFSQRQCKIQLLRDNLGELKVLESALFRLSKNLKSKIFTIMVLPPRYILGLLQAYFELLWGWNVWPLALFFWLACPFLLHSTYQHLYRYFLSSGAFRVIHGCIEPKLGRIRPFSQKRGETDIFFMSPDSHLENQHCNNQLN